MGDGCIFSDRYKGHIRGRILADFENEATDVMDQLPLKGIEIEIVEMSGARNKVMGTGSTDANGFFAIWIDVCRAFEGNNLELFVRIKAENVYYNIRGKKSGGFLNEVEKHEMPHTYWPYANGNTSDLNVGNLIAYHESIKAVHLATLAMDYSLSQPGVSFNYDLEIRTGSDHSYFFPDQACGNPIGWYNTFAGPTIRMESGDVLSETTTWHEFGHFLMWHLQNKCWIDFISGSFAEHTINQNSNTRIAWTEGFANGFAQILDAHYRNLDGESDFDNAGTRFEDRRFRAGVEDRITNGFASEFYVACTLYDLWDGADKFMHLNNSPPFNDAANWNGDIDDISYTFSEIVQVIIDGDPGASSNNNGQIEDIQRFKELLIKRGACDAQVDKLNKCFFRNQILTNLNDAANLVNSDVVYFSTTETYSGDANQASAFINLLTQYSYNSFQKQNLTNFNSNVLRYNLHYAAENQIVNQEINISNGGELLLNNNLAPGILQGNTSTARPPLHSIAFVSLCNQKQISVGANGIVTIGDPSGNYKAELRVKQGSSLRLTSNSTLNINNNSKLIIETGAFLIFESGASINLNGDNAQLSINGGILEIKDNATFTFTGSGFISFDGSTNIAMGTNSHFYLNGSSQNDKVLELTNNTVVNFPHGTGTTKKFTATNCSIDINSGSLEIKSDLYLSSVKIIGAGISGTLKTYGQDPVNIQNSTFENLTYYSDQAEDENGTSPNIDNCVFENADVAVYDKGFNIENSIFNESYLSAENLVLPGNVINTSFNNVEGAAIYYNNLSNATPIILDNVTINGVNGNGSMGVTVIGGLVQLKCTQINVDISAIDMYTGAQLNMSTQNGGLFNRNILTKSSSNSFESEPLINTYEAGVIYLDEGQNVLKKLSTSKYIVGTFNNVENLDIDAENNKWHPSLMGANTMPVAGNFNMSSITQGKNVTIDFSPISTSTLDACGSQSSMMSFTDPCDGPFGCPTSSNLLDNCPSCSSLKIGGVPINKKLKKMLREIALDTLKLNLDNNINRLDSIVNFAMLGNSSAVEKIKDRAYDNYIQLYQEKLHKNQQISQAISLNALSSKVMNSTNSRINKAIADNDSARIVKYLLSKASLYLNKNDDYTTPYNLLNTALNYTPLNAGMYIFIQQQMCIISTEGLYVNKVISSTEFDSLKNECKILYSIKPTASRVIIQNEKELLLRNQETVLDLYPNPASTILNINLKNAPAIAHTYKIMDISGRVILKNSTEQMDNFSLDISELSQGVYMFEIEGDGFVKTGRFVIVR